VDHLEQQAERADHPGLVDRHGGHHWTGAARRNVGAGLGGGVDATGSREGAREVDPRANEAAARI
jgi:hypothetical protein